MVTGPSRAYLWILSREPELAGQTMSNLVGKAKEWGFAVDKLIHVKHSLPKE